MPSNLPVVDPGYPGGGAIWHNLCGKLNESEKKMDWGGCGSSPIDPPMLTMSSVSRLFCF